MSNKWDNRFMKLAREISTWSKDPSSKIGAVIVNDDRRILATGYNGFPLGVADTEERLNNRDTKYKLIVHGEQNALLNALRSGTSVKDGIIYVWKLPVCSDCTKSVIQAGIKRVVIIDPSNASEKWKDQWYDISLPMYNEASVEVIYLHEEDLDK